MRRTFVKDFALSTTKRFLLSPVLGTLLSSGTPAFAGEDPTIIEIRMGDYRFTPAEVQLVANQPAVLRLINTDGMTPHNFRLNTGGQAANIDIDISAGDSVEVKLDPVPEGEYTFYCDKKLPFMKSHREKGMEGRLIVTTE